MKYRNDYHKKNKVIRISPGHYGLLLSVAQRDGITMDEALGLLLELTEQSKGDSAQLPMFEVKASPVIVLNGSKPPLYSRARPELRLEIKAKGVIDGQG